MGYEQTLRLSNREFKRLVGVQRRTFDEIVNVLQDQAITDKHSCCTKKLCLKDQALVCLTYWREYRTYFHIASAGLFLRLICFELLFPV